MKSKVLHYFIIFTFVGLYLLTSLVSTLHSIAFFELSNNKAMAITLAIAFEVGAAASLASIIIMDKMNRFLIWSLFITLTLMQSMSNAYYAYANLHDFLPWTELFGLNEEELIFQKRILSIVSGAILPLIALGFIKSLVDYLRPSKEVESVTENITEEVKVEPTKVEEVVPIEPTIVSEKEPEVIAEITEEPVIHEEVVLIEPIVSEPTSQIETPTKVRKKPGPKPGTKRVAKILDKIEEQIDTVEKETKKNIYGESKEMSSADLKRLAKMATESINPGRKSIKV